MLSICTKPRWMREMLRMLPSRLLDATWCRGITSAKGRTTDLAGSTSTS